MIDVALTELEPLISSSAACRLLGKSRATLHRQRHPRPTPETPAWAARPAPPWALADTERAALLAVLNDDRFADKSPAQVWAILLDEGAYLASITRCVLCSRESGDLRPDQSGPYRRRPGRRTASRRLPAAMRGEELESGRGLRRQRRQCV